MPGVTHGTEPAWVRERLWHAAEEPAVLGVALFGSTARGDGGENSDVDLLVVRDPASTGREVKAGVLAAFGSSSAASLIVQTPAQLESEFATRPSFGLHLADEAVVLLEKEGWKGFDALFRSVAADPTALEREVQRRAGDLKVYERLVRFNGHYIGFMANMYAISRAVVIARLLQRDVHEYSWRSIFRIYSSYRPDLASDLELLEGLRPFYLVSRKGGTNVHQLPPVTDLDAKNVLTAVQRLSRE